MVRQRCWTYKEHQGGLVFQKVNESAPQARVSDCFNAVFPQRCYLR